MKTLVVSHGESGAHHLAHWLKHNIPKEHCDFLLSPEAVLIYSRILHGVKSLNTAAITPEKIANRYDRVIASTSVVNVEKLAVAKAIEAGVNAEIAFDQWHNFEARITLSGRLLEPDGFIVFDHEAAAVIKALTLPNIDGTPISLERNYYLESSASEIKKLTRGFFRRGEATHVLFIGEPNISPTHTTPHFLNQTLKYCLAFKHINKQDMIVRVRLAESSAREASLRLLVQFERFLDVDLSEASSLEEDCAWADKVVGLRDMALVIALHAGKNVYSVLPESLSHLRLPFSGIQSLFKS